MGRNSPLEDFRIWLEHAPPGTSLSAEAVLKWIESEGVGPSADVRPSPAPVSVDLTWRGLFWAVPAETRIGVHELTEALGRPKSWVYRHTSARAVESSNGAMLPHRKLGGELVFVVGEVRAWIRENEEVVVSGPMESTGAERRVFGIIDGRGAA